MHCLHVSKCAVFVAGTCGSHKRASEPLDLELEKDDIQVLETEIVSSAGATIALDNWAIVPTPSLKIFYENFCIYVHKGDRCLILLCP